MMSFKTSSLYSTISSKYTFKLWYSIFKTHIFISITHGKCGSHLTSFCRPISFLSVVPSTQIVAHNLETLSDAILIILMKFHFRKFNQLEVSLFFYWQCVFQGQRIYHLTSVFLVITTVLKRLVTTTTDAHSGISLDIDTMTMEVLTIVHH